MMTTFSLVKGTSRDFPVQINNSDGTPATGVFLGTETLTTNVWSGDSTTTIISPTTTWISANLGQVQISFNNADTTNFVPDTYRIQTTATRSGRSSAIVDALLQVTAAPGTTSLTDLVTQDYLHAALQISGFTDIQAQLLPQLTKAASRLIRKHCNRWFTRRPSSDSTLSAFDGLYTLDWPSRVVVLRQFPVNGILRARTNPTQVFNVTNTSSSNQQATATLSYSGNADISDVAPTTTGITLWSIASGVATTTSLLFATYKTFQSLATAINAVGNGWVAQVADTKYNLWPTADLRQGVGPSCAIGTFAAQGFYVHTDDVPVQVDQDAGVVVLDPGSLNDPWRSPSFGLYLDTGHADLDIGGEFNGVRIVYDAGWDTVPEDVQEATVQTVQDMLNLLNIDQRVQSESDGAYSYSLAPLTSYALTPAVQGLLGYYRNIRS